MLYFLTSERGQKALHIIELMQQLGIEHMKTNGIINDTYGKRGEVNEFGIPVASLPLTFHDYPEGTKSFAGFLEDKDALPVSGGFS